MLIGYARVSTEDQSLALQHDALQAAGCGQVFEDTASGVSAGRKGLSDALARCTAGDVLTVWKLDRLGRSLLDLVRLVEEPKERGVGLKVLTGAGATIDTTKAEGRLSSPCSRPWRSSTRVDPGADEGWHEGGKEAGPPCRPAAQADP